MMYWNGHMTTGGWIMMILWTVIIFALVAAAIYWLANSYRAGASAPKPSEGSPREILDRRLAQGELTVEQYKELRETIDDGRVALGGSGAEPPPSSRPASAHG
jgi:putative membrane protein